MDNKDENRPYLNKVYFKDSRNLSDLPDESVQLIITSPPYFNIKDYSLDGYQTTKHADKEIGQIGDIQQYDGYISEMLSVWKECERVLKPNGKIAINTPLMPMLKKELTTHYNRHVFDINSDIQQSIIKNTNLFLMDVYIWNRTNPKKGLMFGSYPYPRNFYAQNTIEFISIYVKDGKPENHVSPEHREASKLSQEEWVTFTKQVWDIPTPSKKDLAYGKHSAIMPEEIVNRCIRLYSFASDVILDPFAGSGTTLKVANQLGRFYVGYEISKSYKGVIDAKLASNKN